MRKQMKRYIVFVLVLALVISIPISTSFAENIMDPATDAVDVPESQETEIITDEKLDSEIVEEIEKTNNDAAEPESTPAPTFERISETSSITTSNTVSDLTAGEKLGKYFTDPGFAEYTYVKVLGKTSGNASDYELTDSDIAKIEGKSDALTQSGPINGINIESVEGIKYYKNINRLNIWQNKLSGFPDEFAGLTKLTAINCMYNEIKDGVENCYKAPNLNTLQLLGNKIETIPAGISNCKLIYISFALNQISTIPDEIFGMDTITDLALANNKISDIDGVQKLPKLRLFTIANNNVSDFSPLYGIANQLTFGSSGFTQTSGQVKYADKAIKVSENAISAAVDIRNYEFNYCANGYKTGGDKVTVYDKTDLGVAFNVYNYYPQLATPDKITQQIQTATQNVDRANGSKEDNTFSLTIGAFEKADGTTINAVLLRMQAPEATPEVLGSENWTSFYNCDITYIIPVEFEKAAEVKPEEKKPDDAPAVAGEESFDDEDGDNEQTVLGEEAKTSDDMNTVAYVMVMVMLFASLCLFLAGRRNMRLNKE